MRHAAHRPQLVGVAAAILTSLLLCASATAATSPPVLLSPVSFSASSSPLVVRFELPEAASAGTAVLVLKETEPSAETIVVLGNQEDSAGEHTVSLQTHDLTANEHEVKSASPTSALSDGTYEVTLAYQDAAKEPAASASAKEVRIDTVTLTPELTAPVSGAEPEAPFVVDYVLPEAALSGSVELLLEGEETGTSTIVLTSTAAGEHSVTVNPAHPALEPGVASGPARIAPGPYKLHLEYRDALGNPAAATSPIKLTLLAVKCLAGTYSESGRAPCREASPGHFVEGAGQTEQRSCAAGAYNPESGSALASACITASPGHYVPTTGSLEQLECEPGAFAAASGSFVCTPAEPGRYVPTAGATEQLECPAGTYTGVTDSSLCQNVPPGDYAPRGSAFVTACPPGTNRPEQNGTSEESCAVDGPGYFSGQGAAEATKCEIGSFAPNSDTFECAVAQPGYFVAIQGATSELPCPAGSFSPFYGDIQCASAPAGTYAPEGATAPIACPAGSEAPQPRSGSCSAATLPSAVLTATAPSIAAAPPTAQAALKCTLSAAGHQISLHRTGKQDYRLTCNLSLALSARASVTITSGRRRVRLTAGAVTVATTAGEPAVELIHVGLTRAARGLLKAPHARVKVTIALYTIPTSGVGTLIVTASLAGRF
jgi:hypothetical protein